MTAVQKERFWSNRLRPWLASFAYLLVERLRTLGCRSTELARAIEGKNRWNMLKVGARAATPAPPSAMTATPVARTDSWAAAVDTPLAWTVGTTEIVDEMAATTCPARQNEDVEVAGYVPPSASGESLEDPCDSSRQIDSIRAS